MQAPSASALTTLTSEKNIPTCRYAKVKTSDKSDATTISAYVTDDDFQTIDPLALENFTTIEGLVGVKTPLTDTLKGHIAAHSQKLTTATSTATSHATNAKKAAEASKSSIKNKGLKKTNKYNQMSSSDMGDVAASKKQADDNAKRSIIKTYNQYTNTTTWPMDKLFSKFVTYNANNTISPICIYSTLIKVDTPQPISNYYSENDTQKKCSGTEYPQLEPGKFIEALKQYAEYNNYYSTDDKFETGTPAPAKPTHGRLIDITTEFVPPKLTCQLVEGAASATVGMMSGMGPIGLTPDNKTVNPNYNLFWDALEPYREPIINAFEQTDYPKYFGYCPPSVAKKAAPSTTANLTSYENFTPYTSSKSWMTSESWFLLFILIAVILTFFIL